MTRWVTTLIVANVAVYLLTSSTPGLREFLSFVPLQVLERPWAVLTYMFVHADFYHLLFNMLVLFFFGLRVEAYLGERSFLLLYGISGLVGIFLQSLVSPASSILGASGATYGVSFAFAYFWPREIIHIWGIVPIEARWLVAIMTAASIYFGLTGGNDGIAHFVHLGGFLGAYLYLRWAVNHARKKIAKDPAVKVSQAEIERWRSIDRERLHEVNREELDRIQQKLSGSGASTLTPAEKAFLDRFSGR